MLTKRSEFKGVSLGTGVRENDSRAKYVYIPLQILPIWSVDRVGWGVARGYNLRTQPRGCDTTANQDQVFGN